MNSQSNAVTIEETLPSPSGRGVGGEGDKYPHIGRVQEYFRTKGQGMSQAEFGRRIGYSATAISLYLKRKYDAGDLAAINEAISQYFEAEDAYRKYQHEVKEIVITSQIREVMGAIMFVERRQSFGIIIGEAGIGKTMGMEEFHRANRSRTLLITLDALKKSPTAFVQTLWRKVPGNRNRKSMPKAAFLIDDLVYYFKNLHKTILIDEAQFLSNDALELARSIQDQAHVGFVLGGTFDIDDVIGFGGRVPLNAQLYSRVKVHCEVNPAIDRADLAQMAALYQTQDEAIVQWLFERCNQPGRRYRWVTTIMNAALDLTTDTGKPLDVKALERAAKQIGLSTK